MRLPWATVALGLALASSTRGCASGRAHGPRVQGEVRRLQDTRLLGAYTRYFLTGYAPDALEPHGSWRRYVQGVGLRPVELGAYWPRPDCSQRRATRGNPSFGWARAPTPGSKSLRCFSSHVGIGTSGYIAFSASAQLACACP
jgi:hypothetical protein